MKGINGGRGLQYVIVIWLAVLLGCLALSAQCDSQLLKKAVVRTRGVHLIGSPGRNTSAYHTEIECPTTTSAAAGDDESKVKLIFCTVKCYCHGVHGDDICYCCQKPPGAECYEQLADCQANCPICNPECPPAPPETATEGKQLPAATTNATSSYL